MEGEQPFLGDLLAVVINHLQTWMIFQVALFFSVVDIGFSESVWERRCFQDMDV